MSLGTIHVGLGTALDSQRGASLYKIVPEPGQIGHRRVWVPQPGRKVKAGFLEGRKPRLSLEDELCSING